MKYNLISYAMDFASFLVQKISGIDRIILFGSVARDEADKKSDIDLFIEIPEKNNEKKIKDALDKFMESNRYKDYWKLLGVENQISLKIGRLDDWPDLKTSIIANGLVLYGKFKPDTKQGKHKTFFIWENIKPNSKRVLFNKQLFGYKQNKKFYEGLIQKYRGERLGKGCIIVPLEYSNKVHQLFKKHKITVRIKKVLEY